MTGIGNPPITWRRSPWLCWKISAETVLLYMTVEEFFQKKKIDLTTLGAERPALLDEFKKHFEAMGEKSFDHNKKYWFNKLRRRSEERRVGKARVSTRRSRWSPAH